MKPAGMPAIEIRIFWPPRFSKKKALIVAMQRNQRA
jgi:hypothetical protein